MGRKRMIFWLRGAALLVMLAWDVLWGIIFLRGGVPISNDLVTFLFPILFFVVMAALSWKWPLAGGGTLVLLGLLMVFNAIFSTIAPDTMPATLLISAGPFLFMGILFFSAGVLSRRA